MITKKIRRLSIFWFLLFGCLSSQITEKNDDIYFLNPREQYGKLIISACSKNSEVVLKIILNPYSIGRYRIKYKNSDEVLENIRSMNKKTENLAQHCKTKILNESIKGDLSVVSILFPGESIPSKTMFRNEEGKWYFLGTFE